MTNNYEMKAYQEVQAWRIKVMKRSGMANRFTKKAQNKINSWIPEQVHKIVTDSIKNMVKATLAGSNMMTKKLISTDMILEERDKLLEEKHTSYRKTAVIEGAGTGAGGLLLGAADFPLLLSIKIKFLFEAAAIYGFDTSKYDERLFLLYVFQLAFSSEEKRRETLFIIENWDEQKEKLVDMDWRVFQQEYRDHIDLIKIFQLIPGFGAIVGAYANHNLMDRLAETALNVYRMRILDERPRND
ncbi:EcsC family protein [Oceanobacillus rekensis]|uniref:EcsC family protein n=1 Tax=Oceanobacillus rekensis TaxID=937927 RepID=UPI000B44E198|nr:EcsC family protein [Oceanobacillus rekensis]